MSPGQAAQPDRDGHWVPCSNGSTAGMQAELQPCQTSAHSPAHHQSPKQQHSFAEAAGRSLPHGQFPQLLASSGKYQTQAVAYTSPRILTTAFAKSSILGLEQGFQTLNSFYAARCL